MKQISSALINICPNAFLIPTFMASGATWVPRFSFAYSGIKQNCLLKQLYLGIAFKEGKEYMVTLEELRTLQLAVLDIYKEFDRICRDNNLIYYLNGGCMIGAIRHKGFIPWDDDMDIVMPRDDYNKLVDILKRCENFNYIVNHYSTDNYNSGSYILKLCNPTVKYGKKNGESTLLYDSFLSVFPLNGAPKSRIKQKIFENRVKLSYIYLRMVRTAHFGVISGNHNMVEKIGIVFNRVFNIGKHESVSSAAEKLDKLLQRYRYDESDYVCEFSYGIAPFIWNKSMYSKPELVSFENLEVPAPTQYIEYLQILYGDYMQLPPVEKQIPKHIDFIISNQR